MFEDFSDHPRLGDESDHAQLAAAGTQKWVELKNSSDKICPPTTQGLFTGGAEGWLILLSLVWRRNDLEAVLLAKKGAVSLMIDAPYHRPDIDSYSFVTEPEAEREGYIQLVGDLRRGFDLLAARKDVDPKRIGYVGHSLGATWGGALAGIVSRFAGYVLMGGLPRLTDVLGDDSYAKLIQQAFTREQLERYVEILSPINPELLVGRAAPGSILFQFARHDRFISDASARDYVKAAGDSHEVRWYFTSHEFNDPDSSRDRLEFLAKKLGLTP
jgi:dienelactone hydrolase